jgi:hypothetical protein
MDRILRINAPSVVAEIIDGEAVIMDLASGHYFSTQHVGCDIWRGVEGGSSQSAIVESLLESFEVDETEVAPAVDAFLRDLLERKLIVEREVHTRPSVAGTDTSPSGGERRKDFAAPVLHAYSDMEDLLLLDPIHDVDEAGWPRPKPPDDAR